jgi:hypothetical protein
MTKKPINPTQSESESAGPGESLPAILLAQPNTAINISLNNEHLISVAVNRAETRLKSIMQQAVSEAQRLQAETSSRQEDLKKIYEAAKTDPTFVDSCNKFVDEAAKLNIKLKLKIEKGDLIAADRSFVVKAIFDHRGEGSGYYGGQITTTRVHKLGEEADALWTQIGELKQQQDRQSMIARDARSKLADLPALERQARAKLAEYALRRTAEGSDLLDALLANLDQEVDAMPSLRQLGLS